MLEDSISYSSSQIIADDMYYKMILDLLRTAGPERNAEIVEKVMNQLDLQFYDKRETMTTQTEKDSQEGSRIEESF